MHHLCKKVLVLKSKEVIFKVFGAGPELEPEPQFGLAAQCGAGVGAERYIFGCTTLQ